jgi:tetratricopeptide (TPR) repeat protein
MITFQCQYCGSRYQISDNCAGKNIKCKKCGKNIIIPINPFVTKDPSNVGRDTSTINLKSQEITMNDEPSYMSTATKVGIGIITTGLILSIGFWIWLIANRDTWEIEHRYQVLHLCEEIYPLIQSNDPNAGVQKYNELLQLIGNRKLQDNDMNKVVSDIREVAEPVQKNLLKEQRRQKELQKEAETLSKLKELESEAKSFVNEGDFEQGIEKYQEALDLVKNTKSDNTDLISLIGRISQAKTLASEKLSHKKQIEEVERKRIEEDKKLARVKASVKGGAWITKKAGNSETIRGLKIFAIKSVAKNEHMIAMLQATLEGDRERLEKAKDEVAKYNQLEKELNEKMKGSKNPEVLREGLNLLIRIYEEENAAQKRVDTLEPILKNTEKKVGEASKVNSSAPIDLKLIFSVVSENAGEGENVTWNSICSQLLIGQTHTDVDGKYSIELPGGNYYLSAMFDSSYSRVDWLVPIRIGETKDVSVDLHNENAFRIINKND